MSLWRGRTIAPDNARTFPAAEGFFGSGRTTLGQAIPLYQQTLRLRTPWSAMGESVMVISSPIARGALFDGLL
ncbi:hypothetical protein ACIBI9_64545 [Nonomuraea sp. NPDC050451]|uniref:hypothetical protein n=1 Tax=Nonomuraea sp. NPDC050451 TaxID=3364364 RepID=UPI0037AD3A5F